MPALLKLHILYVFENIQIQVYDYSYYRGNLKHCDAFCKKQQARGLNVSLNCCQN